MALISETGEKRCRDYQCGSTQSNNPLYLHHDQHVPFDDDRTCYCLNWVVHSVSALYRRDLAQDFPLRLDLVVEVKAILTAPRLVPFECALRNQDMKIDEGPDLWLRIAVR
jgi:hypothetical protein